MNPKIARKIKNSEIRSSRPNLNMFLTLVSINKISVRFNN
jgi:hypothetical protein